MSRPWQGCPEVGGYIATNPATSHLDEAIGLAAAEAAAAYRSALGLAGNPAEQRFLQRRLSAVEALQGPQVNAYAG